MEDGDAKKRAAFHAIVGRALTDATFRGDLKNESARRLAVSGVLQGTGVEYSDIEKDLNAAVEAVEDLAAHFDDDLKAAS